MSSGDAAQLDDEFARLVGEPIADPRPFYAELRERAPVYRTPFDFWYVTRSISPSPSVSTTRAGPSAGPRARTAVITMVRVRCHGTDDADA